MQHGSTDFPRPHNLVVNFDVVAWLGLRVIPLRLPSIPLGRFWDRSGVLGLETWIWNRGPQAMITGNGRLGAQASSPAAYGDVGLGKGGSHKTLVWNLEAKCRKQEKERFATTCALL